MPTTIRTSEPRELLSLVPFQLGFRPTRSAVLLSLRGERSRVGLVARVDLADLTDPVHGDHVARALVTHLTDDGAQRAILVVYPGASRARAASTVAAVRDVVGRAAEPELRSVDCWVVGPGGYYGADCADPGCCPGEGRPLEELQSTQIGAQMVLTGAAVLPSRDDVGRIDPAPDAARRAARRAALRWARRVEGAVEPAELHAWRSEGHDVWRAELARVVAVVDGTGGSPGAVGEHVAGAGGGGALPVARPLPAVVAGRLQAFLADVLCRDAVLLGLVPGSARTPDRLLAGEDGDVGHVLAAVLDPGHGLPPDPVVTAAATVLLEQVAAHSSRRAQAPALTLLALLAWWAGDGARAGVLVDRARAADPDHRLAALVSQTLAAGMAPGWLRRGSS